MNVTNPGKIESALQQLSTTTVGADSPDSAPLIKSKQANFIILAHTTSGGELAEKVLNDTVTGLASKQLYRFFILKFDPSPDASERLDAAVNSRQVKLDTGHAVLSEEIYLTFGTKRVKSIKNLLLSLYVPDVEIIVLALTPVVIMEQPDFFPLFKEIMISADKVIYDSEFLPAGAAKAQLCKLSPIYSLRPNHEEGAGVWDVSWMRTRRWRILVAESFESQELLLTLPNLDRLTIVELATPDFADWPEPLSKSLLLGAWVLSRLGIPAEAVTRAATKAKYDGLRWSYRVRFGDSEFELNFERVADDKVNRSVISTVSFDFPKNRSLRISRDFARAEALVAFDGETRAVPFVSPTFDQLAMQVISAGRDSERFQSAHKLALHLSAICKS